MNDEIRECTRTIGDALNALKETLKGDTRRNWVTEMETLLPKDGEWTESAADRFVTIALSVEEWGGEVEEAAQRLRFAAEDIGSIIKSP